VIGLIWAEANNCVIGNAGVMPWHIPEDLAHFKEITLGAPVIMGRKTWESLPERFRPLPGRRNLVVTRNAGWSSDGVEAVLSLESAVQRASEGLTPAEAVWIIGGGEIFAQALPIADRIELTQINAGFEGDSFAPNLGTEWFTESSIPSEGWMTSTSGLEYRFLRLSRSPAR